MKHLILLLISAVGFVQLNAQQSTSSIKEQQIYVCIDTFRTDLKLLIVNPIKIESVDVLKGEHAVSKYGSKATDGAIIIKTKAGVKLLRLNDILSKYKIAAQDRNLRVCINNTMVTNTALLVIEESEITAVEITTEHNWINAEEANSKERFINIKTGVSLLKEK